MNDVEIRQALRTLEQVEPPPGIADALFKRLLTELDEERAPRPAPPPARLRRLPRRVLIPAFAVIGVIALISAAMVFLPRPQSALAVVEDAIRKFEHVPAFHAFLQGHVPAEQVAFYTRGEVRTESRYRYEVWYRSSEAWRLTLVDNSLPVIPPGKPGFFQVRNGPAQHTYSPEDNTFGTASYPPLPPERLDVSPLGTLGWEKTGDKLRDCSDAGGELELLPDETVAGRDARHIRCSALRLEVWIDAETGLLLREVQRVDPAELPPVPPGGRFLNPGDRFEVVSVEYDPSFPPGIFEFVPPPGATPGLQPPGDTSIPSEDQGMGPPIGEPAPAWSGPLLGGGTFRLTDLRGKRVLVLFWMDTCPTKICGSALDQFQDAFERSSPRIALVSVVLQPDVHRVERGVARGGYTFPVVLDGSNEISKLWRATAAPMLALLDEDGRTVAIRMGPEDIGALLADYFGN